ncbi:MAG: hypothetical protein A2171_01285 [Candidatus Levybacteria bacterium RBG_13_35_9]|nr:MAG: hypothetical protein A2171_01285 [Candidatus Levybacteria bacterium RBG_13_35_9]
MIELDNFHFPKNLRERLREFKEKPKSPVEGIKRFQRQKAQKPKQKISPSPEGSEFSDPIPKVSFEFPQGNLIDELAKEGKNPFDFIKEVILAGFALEYTVVTQHIEGKSSRLCLEDFHPFLTNNYGRPIRPDFYVDDNTAKKIAKLSKGERQIWFDRAITFRRMVDILDLQINGQPDVSIAKIREILTTQGVQSPQITKSDEAYHLSSNVPQGMKLIA